MEAHGFGKGEYKYFEYPLPPLVAKLRTAFYPHLAQIANGWRHRLGKPDAYPEKLTEYLEICKKTGQTKSTPSLLSYKAEDYNCLHQDHHGENMFPLQVAVLLNVPGEDFEGGEFLMHEQRPRKQTRGIVVEPFRKCDGVLFTANSRPIHGTNGEYQVKMKHGVNRVRAGHRRTLGIIFHDAA